MVTVPDHVLDQPLSCAINTHTVTTTNGIYFYGANDNMCGMKTYFEYKH